MSNIKNDPKDSDSNFLVRAFLAGQRLNESLTEGYSVTSKSAEGTTDLIGFLTESEKKDIESKEKSLENFISTNKDPSNYPGGEQAWNAQYQTLSQAINDARKNWDSIMQEAQSNASINNDATKRLGDNQQNINKLLETIVGLVSNLSNALSKSL